jgi:hypothetical protein
MILSSHEGDERNENVVSVPTTTCSSSSSSSSNSIWQRRNWRRVCAVLLPLAVVVTATFRHGVRVQQASLGAIKAGRSYEDSLEERQRRRQVVLQQQHSLNNNNQTQQQQQQQQQQHALQQHPKKSPKNITKKEDEEEETKNININNNIKNNNKRLNIVLFYADDWTMNVMGKWNPHVQTPIIDRMADNGMLFSNNCVTSSVCWMS